MLTNLYPETKNPGISFEVNDYCRMEGVNYQYMMSELLERPGKKTVSGDKKRNSLFQMLNPRQQN